jgi:ribosomal protein S18 acetylase RimI-like enzyme
VTDLVIRPLEPGEEELFESLPDAGLVGVAAFGRDYRKYLAAGEYRPQWTWVALRDGKPVARAAWWAGPKDTEPRTLDWFDFTDLADGVALLRAAAIKAEYCVLLPAGWRDIPEVKRAADMRIEAALQVGMTPLVERLRYMWTPRNPLPSRPTRLEYRPEPDDDVFFEVLRRIQEGSLDAHARKALDKGGLDLAAQEDLDFLRWMPSPREWWRLAYTPGGELAGLTVPGRNYSGPVIGLIGVVPEQRGNGYAYDLLVEATHLLVDEGVEQITAETDVTNTPMARNFAKAGYPIVQERVYLT